MKGFLMFKNVIYYLQSTWKIVQETDGGRERELSYTGLPPEALTMESHQGLSEE